MDIACGTIEQCGDVIDCGACEVVEVAALEPEHLIADPERNRVYVTVGGGARQFANELVVIDPQGGVTVESFFVGSNPSAMAISEDSTTLWVGLDGSLELRRVDLTTPSPTVGESFSLPPGEFGALGVAGSLVVLPDTQDSVAVSLHRYEVSPSFAGVAILDNGIARPGQTPGHTGASRLTGGPNGWVFGYNNLSTGFGFYAIEVEAGGATQTEQEDLISGFNTDIAYADGRVYATSGEVVDVSSPGAPAPAGVFEFAGAVLPQPELGRLMMLSAYEFGDSGPVLRNLDLETFTQSSEAYLAALDAVAFVDLVTADGLTLGVIGYTGGGSDERKVYLIDNPFSE